MDDVDKIAQEIRAALDHGGPVLLPHVGLDEPKVTITISPRGVEATQASGPSPGPESWGHRLIRRFVQRWGR